MTVPITAMADAETLTADDQAGFGALQTVRGNLPLRRIDVRADITALTSQVELTQDFVNPHDVPLEASYVFPLPDRAAVTRMRMTAGGRVVEADLRERAAARETYDKAAGSGRRASIAEEERPDVFTVRVGSIRPGEKISVAMTLVSPLAYEDGEATFRFPLVVAPRYIPGAALDDTAVGDGYADDTDAVPDASRISPPVLLPGFPHPVELTIAVGVNPAGLTLSGIRSSLPTETDDGGRIRVLPGARADRDLVLRLRYGAEDLTDSLILSPDPDGDEGTYQLTVLPPAASAPPRPRDLVLLLDHSGSMAGWKLVAARRAAARIVDTLTSADRFAVLTFDEHLDRPTDFPDALVEANDRNRFRAVEHLARIETGSGTELFAPLRRALTLLRESRSRAGRDAIVILVTDGQVGNEDQLLRGLSDDLRRVRVHTVGVDQAVNAGFLRRLAVLGGGRCELVESEGRLDEAMEAIHRRIAAPLARSLTLHPEGLVTIDDTASPARTPDLFPGVPLVLTGRYRGSSDGSVVMRGVDGDGADWSISVAAERRETPEVTAQWARAHLRDLEDRYSCAGGRSGDSSPQALATRIVDTSLRFGVLCRFTAFVAVDSRVVAEGELQHRVMQPVEAPAGWDPDRPVTTATARTVKLRNVIAVAVTSVLLVGGGGLAWSQTRDGTTTATREATPSRTEVAGGKLTEMPDDFRGSEPSGRIPAPVVGGSGISDQTTVNQLPAQVPLSPPTDTEFKRDIVTNGSMQLVVADPGGVADRLIGAITDAGGRVDSRSERSGASAGSPPMIAMVLRIPADKLDGILADAKKLGTVSSMSVSHTDVTTQRVDLDARIAALQTSVKRLLELMGRAGTVADLLAAESSLTQRQAELDSLAAQRTTLHDEVSYATISVNISSEPAAAPAGTGFLGALEQGWNSVLSVAHGAVLTIGFLLPWLALLALPVLALVLVLRRRFAGRAAGADPGSGGADAPLITR